MVQIICILAALTAAILFSDSSLAIFVSSAIGTVCALAVLYRFGRPNYPLKLTALLASGLLLGYCGGTAYTQVAYALTGNDAIAVIGIPNSYISYALAMVFGACAMLFFASFLETAFIPASEIFVADSRLEVFLWISVLLALAAYRTGEIGFSATNFLPGGARLGVLAGIAGPATPVVFPFAALGVVQLKGAARFRFGILAIAGILLLLLADRRAVFYSLLLMLWVILRHSGRELHLTIARKIFVVTAVLLLLAFSNLFYFGLRNSASDLAWRQGGTVSVGEGLRVAKTGIFTDPRSLLHGVQDNLKDRTFVISYLALLGRAGQSSKPMWGADAAFEAKLLIPDAFYRFLHRSKDQIRAIETEEGLANEHFHLNVTDEANSILTGGYIDFGFAGVLFYPLIICFGLRFAFVALSSFVDHQVMVIVAVMVLSALIQTECDLGSYIALFRTTTMFAIAYGVLFQGPLPLFFRHFHRSALPVDESNSLETDRGSVSALLP